MALDNFSRFLQLLETHGLEYFGKYYGTYKGFVFSNEDEEFLGRLQVEVPQVYGQEVPEIWAWSKGMYTGKGVGLYALPGKGDPVWVTFENGNPQHPIWEYGWISTGDTPESAKKDKNTNFVFQTGGNRLEFNEEDSTVTITSKAGFIIKMDSSGIHVGKDMGGTAVAIEDMFSDILQGLIDAKTLTQMGAQPLVNVATFTKLKQKIAGIQSKKITIIK